MVCWGVVKGCIVRGECRVSIRWGVTGAGGITRR